MRYGQFKMLDVKVSISRKRMSVTTDSRHDPPVAPNRLNRNFSPVAPNQAWTGDITYIATEEGRLFVAVVINVQPQGAGLVEFLCKVLH